MLHDVAAERAGASDLTMMDHVFDHMDKPVGVLKDVSGLLAPDGTLLIRGPVVDSYAWEHCCENLVQLDLPPELPPLLR